MSILKEANLHFREKNYAKALELLEKAGTIYGAEIVEFNIRLCKKALTQPPSSVALPNKSPNPSPTSLDPATRYLLARAGKLTLSKYEQQQCLEQHRQLTNRKSEDAEVKAVTPIPSDWPKDLVLAPLPESTNDWRWHLPRRQSLDKTSKESLPGLSIVIPTFNRSKILDVTLACLVNQQTKYPFEVVVADDGSKEPIDQIVRRYDSELDIKYVRQKDYGYQLCAARNLGLRTAKYEFVSILDCDMAPNPKWVESYMDLLVQDADVALIGPRKYVDTSALAVEEFLKDKALIEKLPEIKTNNNVSGKDHETISVDWRLDHFRQTEDLRLCDSPFRFFSGGNVAFARKWLGRAGWFDEEFTLWGGEDNEFGYRLYRQGCFFRTAWGAMAYHQEPPGKENETDRAKGKNITIEMVREKVPYFYRKVEPLTSASLHKRPLVSIYIPAYNCVDSIVRCVNSALNQTVVDLEVCICNDGSTDHTLELLSQQYGENPRVRVMTQVNAGIGAASNAAVRMAQGYYIGQLDSDDYLEPDAVELCLKEFFSNRRLVCVYTTNRNVNSHGVLVSKGFNFPIYSNQRLVTEMIVHHFRMFTARAFSLTDGFDEKIKNAVDYDFYLKLSEIGEFKHLNKIAYNRVLHEKNTSIQCSDIQKTNHFRVINAHLRRQEQYIAKLDPKKVCSDTIKGLKISPKKGSGLRSRSYEFKHQHCLNKEFDKVYVVNLESEIRKKAQITMQLEEMGVEYVIWQAVNGYEGDVAEQFNKYKKRPLGALERYKNFSDKEIKRKSHFIESPGALGYIHTYIKILKDALKNNYNKILIIEDDVIFSKDFDVQFVEFMGKIKSDWAVLQLGASQYGWESVDIEKAYNNGYYYPRRLDTCGSFAIGISRGFFQELINEQSFFEAPFDHLPMGEIYEKNIGNCYVAFPNLVMPDVSTSTIRNGRNQWEHAIKMKWDMKSFSFPTRKPRLNILVTQKNSIRSIHEFSAMHKYCDIGFFWLSEDGLRPIHGEWAVHDHFRISVDALDWSFSAPIDGDWLAVREGTSLLENDLFAYMAKTELRSWERSKKLIPISTHPFNEVKDRASVIIPTHGDPLNLNAAIESVLIQDYPDIEVIVVSDNFEGDAYNEKIKDIINDNKEKFIKQSKKRSLKLIEHKINRNGAAARNTGILASTGEFVQFLDDDDIYLDGRIPKAIQTLKALADVDAVYCGFKGWNSSGNDPARYESDNLTYDILALNYERHYVHTNTMTYKRSALLSINGFDETYRRHQDLELNIRFLSRFKITTHKEILVQLRPKPKFVSYIPKGRDFILLKIKFFTDFSERIKLFSAPDVLYIYKKHAEELRRVLKDESFIENELRSIPCEASFGLLTALSAKCP